MQRLADALRGPLLRPGDPDYEERRRVWNGAIDRRPLAIARCADAEDVSIAVKFAAKEHLPLTVRGGGHNVAGLAVRDGSLMLDLGALNRVEVDARARIVRVEGGALWRDVDAATQPHGLATTGGFVSSTGVGGLTLGGGVGWLMRQYGLTIDNLLSADVVLADGRCVVASAEQHADLFWALRGGAGGLGVVTRFAFRLHEVGEVLAGAVFHPLEAAPALLRAFRAFVPTAPEPCTFMLVFTAAPPAPFLPPRVHGQRVLALAYCWSGDPTQGEQAMAPLTGFGEPLGRVGGAMPYAAWQQSFDVHAPAGDHYYWTTSILDGLDDGLIDALVLKAAMAPDPLCEVHVHHLGGVVAALPADASAFAHRDAPFFINAIGHAQGPEKLTEVREWARELRSSLLPWAREGMQPNFAGEAADWQAQTHDAATRARLEGIRRKYDPSGLFGLVRRD
ncbi:FAD-binding oxidoreductase [Rhodanobacter sp. C03]|uniref:FAD-binding oxidoreductase n=1 Tax=Rhodanobacter sp. C03 TaxID=1945858 RepID=UPI0014396031|nr:FAD-binding oxidoreductase [Rhodanobacter sp. C03]